MKLKKTRLTLHLIYCYLHIELFLINRSFSHFPIFCGFYKEIVWFREAGGCEIGVEGRALPEHIHRGLRGVEGNAELRTFVCSKDIDSVSYVCKHNLKYTIVTPIDK